ncbi:hypothetical protein JOF53_004280 [Crossiella equi]|uniref:Endonuclease n=1 Tax=Crossiella equi TaxID=130796 RepID=A0ABS5AFQ5_9PSEU|nr:endonuclease [Crossiella equi]MBP2475408.1 hypothetical protein [Crossiella equi]
MDVEELLAEHGETYAEQAGITLADKPAPLYRLLVLATLLSAPITSDVAIRAARELKQFGTPAKMREATWQQRVDALGRGHYRRYDESTSTALGEAAELLRERWRDDLRRLHEEADGDLDRLRELLTEFPRLGPVGADIFCREAQAVWPDLRPYFDEKAMKGAAKAGLPKDPAELAGLVDGSDQARLAAALVRVSTASARRSP